MNINQQTHSGIQFPQSVSLKMKGLDKSKLVGNKPPSIIYRILSSRNPHLSKRAGALVIVKDRQCSQLLLRVKYPHLRIIIKQRLLNSFQESKVENVTLVYPIRMLKTVILTIEVL